MSDTPLSDRVGLDSTARASRLAYLKFSDADAAVLAEMRPFLESIADELVDVFYEHLSAFEETAPFLEDRELVTRLKKAQREHFLGLCDVAADVEIFERRLAVGMVHAQVGLPPHLYLGAYLLQMRFVQERLFVAFAAEPGRIQAYLDALWKSVILDIQLATDAYIYGGFVERSLAEAYAREAERARGLLEAKQAEEERREELLNMVIHDVRSPVTAMMASARAGLRTYDDITVKPGKQFSRIEESGGNALRIIDDILTHSRLINGRMPLKPESFDLAETVTACVNELRTFATQTGHILSTESPPSLPVEGLDPVLVRRIVSNLVVNALRHTPAGGNVSVACGYKGKRVEIRVKDDGPGIPGHIRRRIFESKGGRLRRSEGAYVDSGLGLPFCWLAAESLGGRIRIEESGDRGACFLVELPAGADL